MNKHSLAHVHEVASMCHDLVSFYGEVKGQRWIGIFLSLDPHNIHRVVNRRAALMELLTKYRTERGTVFVEESGMDCDCTQYSGRIHECPATMKGFSDLYDQIAEGVDGPFSLTVISEGEAKQTEYQSRDLALEAFENGHPHVIYPE